MSFRIRPNENSTTFQRPRVYFIAAADLESVARNNYFLTFCSSSKLTSRGRSWGTRAPGGGGLGVGHLNILVDEGKVMRTGTTDLLFN